MYNEAGEKRQLILRTHKNKEKKNKFKKSIKSKVAQ
jgi:hypothetical protein